MKSNNMQTIPKTIIRFPEIELRTRDAHKLRGYFGNLFKEKSELLHNHMGNGEFRFQYPKVQYKVIDRTPLLVGVKEGAELLPELFLKIKELDIDGKKYPVHQKNIESGSFEIGVTDASCTYEFQTLWMALNQSNHEKYQDREALARQQLLERIVTGNCLSFFKDMGLWVDDQIHVKGSFKEKSTRFKNNRMLAFEGVITTNVVLPDYIGLGKAVSRGFGTIKQIS
ncbi:MAG TPA: CRISPR-associated endonuclease Cas6 [Bacteroidales bacterium]|nr:CRISPR-associated endonuclease Cas6 [Bacteroidales bacterium]